MNLGQRLDALLQRLDNADFGQDEEPETGDFLNFLDEDEGQLDQDADPADLGSEPDVSDPNLSEEEDPRDHPAELPGSSADANPGPREGSPVPETEQRLSEQPAKEASKKSTRPEPAHEKRTSAVRRGAAAMKAEMENRASEDQRLRRSLRDVEARTAKPRTVESFIAELDSDSDNEDHQSGEPKSDRERDQDREHREKVLLSSPPKMQGLRSFLETAHDSSDSELEIVPETKKNRMSKPVRDMLRLGGNNTTTSARKLAQMKHNLARLQSIQINQRRAGNREKLEQIGLDVAQLEKEMEASRAKAGGTYAWLELEREKAEKFAQHSGEESDPEPLEFSDNDRMDARATRAPRKLVLSDSEDDDDNVNTTSTANVNNVSTTVVNSASSANTENTESLPVSAPAAGPQDTQYIPPVSQPVLAKMLGEVNGEDASDAHHNVAAGHTGTQYVEPVSESVMAKMLDLEDTEAASTQYVAPVSNSVMAEMLGIEEENAENAENAEEATDSGLDNPGEIPGESDPEFEAPDLSDITGTLSQRIAEVRKRYLARKARERLEAEQKRHASALVEDEAEESDEEGGEVPRDDGEGDIDSDQDGELEELVNRAHVNVRESEVHRKFAEEERMRDEKLLGRLVQGVNGGGFRRDAMGGGPGGPGGLFLGEDFDETGEDAVSLALKAAAASRREKLLQGNARAAKLASNAKASAFFSSISEDLVARPGARPKTTVEESLQYLRSVECNPSILPSTSAAAAATNASGPVDSAPAPPIKISVRRTSTITANAARARSGTYASSIASADVGSKSVDILQSLGGAKQTNKKPKRQFVAPIAPPLAKKRQVSGTAPAHAVFGRRSWA